MFLAFYSGLSAHSHDKGALQRKGHHQFRCPNYFPVKVLDYYKDEGVIVSIKATALHRSSAEGVPGGRAEFGVASTDMLRMRSA